MADGEVTDPDGFPESAYVEQISKVAFAIWEMKVGIVDSSAEQRDQFRETLDARCAGLAHLRGLTW